MRPTISSPHGRRQYTPMRSFCTSTGPVHTRPVNLLHLDGYTRGVGHSNEGKTTTDNVIIVQVCRFPATPDVSFMTDCFRSGSLFYAIRSMHCRFVPESLASFALFDDLWSHETIPAPIGENPCLRTIYPKSCPVRNSHRIDNS